MAIEAGDRRQRPALHLDDRDAQTGGVEHDLLEGAPPLWDDEEPACGPPGGEDLFDGATTGDQLLIRAEEIGGRQRVRRAWPRSASALGSLPSAPARASTVRAPGVSVARAGPPARWIAAVRRRTRAVRRRAAWRRREATSFPRWGTAVRGLATSLARCISSLRRRAAPIARTKIVVRPV
jgi:hypothetical protein